MRCFALIIILFLHIVAKATYLDLNTLYYSDQFTTASDVKMARTQYDLGLGFDITKSRQLILCLDSGSTTLNDTTATLTTSLVISDLGLKLVYFWDKGRAFSTAVSYNIISTGKYNDGISAVELRGNSTKADLGYNFWLGDSFAVGLKFFYYLATYKESVANSTITAIAFKRTLMYPSISLIYDY